jgi:hypothetical protein
MKKKTHEEYLQELDSKDIIYRPLELYKGSNKFIEHSCPYGHTWYGRPDRVLARHGCNKCSINTFKTHKQYEYELFKKEIDANPLENYVGANIAILHECINNHVWKVSPSALLNRSRGCPLCSTSGFNIGKPAILYFISFEYNSTKFYKVGITNRTVYERYSDESWEKLKITIVWELKFDIGKDARELEKSLLDKYKEFKVNTGALKSGNTETLSIEIFKPLL